MSIDDGEETTSSDDTTRITNGMMIGPETPSHVINWTVLLRREDVLQRRMVD